MRGARATPDGEDTDILSLEEVTRWRGLAEGGDRAQAKLARVVLKKHAEAVARAGGVPAAGDPLAESPRPAEQGEPQDKLPRPGRAVKT